jgi:hypothetical protein
MAESSPSTPCRLGPSPLRCLVTGASGYIGGPLAPELLAAGYAVRCIARDPGKLSDRPGPAMSRSRRPTHWRGPECGALWRVSMWPIT